MKRIPIIAVVAALAIALSARSDPAAATTAETIDAADPRVQILRKSCYMRGTDDPEQDAADTIAAGCRFVRYYGYSFPVSWPCASYDPRTGSCSIDRAPYFTQLGWSFEKTKRFIAALPRTVAVEYIPPEKITESIDQYVIDPAERTEIKTKFDYDLPARFRFAEMRSLVNSVGVPSPNPDWYWDCLYQDRCDPDETRGVNEKNGNLAMDKPQSQAFLVYLAYRLNKIGVRAMTVGAPEPANPMLPFVKKVREVLASNASGPIFLGTSCLDQPGSAALKPFVDYCGQHIDIDVYRNRNGRRIVLQGNPDGGAPPPPASCYELPNTANNDRLLPLPPLNAESANLCLVDNGSFARGTRAPATRSSRNWIESNPLGIPVMLNFDDDFCGQNGAVFVPNQSGLPEKCYREVRHGLTSPMIWITRRSTPRQLWVEYMVRIAKKLSTEKGRNIYFPVPLIIGEKKIRYVYANALTDDRWEEQKRKQPNCPSDGTDDVFGVTANGDHQSNFYRARVCSDLDNAARVLALPQ